MLVSAMADGSTRGEPLERLEGTVERVVFAAQDTGYRVVRLRGDDGTLHTVVGRGGALEVGSHVVLQGAWTAHPEYGRQFRYETVMVTPARTTDQVERRIQRYPGVGPAMASRIVRRFGMDTLRLLDREPGRLREIPGLGPRTLERIVAYHKTHHGPKAAIEARLAELGVPIHLADRIFRRYGPKGLELIDRDPFRLARDIEGIGFVTADRIARAQGMDPTDPRRLKGGLLYTLEKAEADGHCALPRDELLARAQRLLDCEPPDLWDAYEELRREGHLIPEAGEAAEPLVFRLSVLRAERAVAEAISELILAEAAPLPEVALPRHLSPGQRAAVDAVRHHRFVVLTGGPGTGKSTVVRHVLHLAKAGGIDAILCAPTGRAAKRMEEATGHSASTIHRLLEIEPETGRFRHGPDLPLPPGLVVVDEVSMLDIHLARALLSALSSDHRVLLVGDADQLPSVGPGNVLRDILDAADRTAGAVAVRRLRRIFRQAEGSSIVENAHRILEGRELVPDPPGPSGAFFVVPCRSAQQAHEAVVRLVTERIPRAYGFDPRTDVQVLVPMHRGPVGTMALNEALQAKLSPPGTPEVTVPGDAGRVFRVGDRVLQTRNDYKKNVFNGDVGVVVEVDPGEGAVVVDMEGQRVRYGRGDFGSLTLAYAISIHKSQGSEFPAVVVALSTDHHLMLRRNLLYTAVTRAERLCVVVAHPRALQRALRRQDALHRHTGLARRIVQALSAGPHFDPVPEN